MAIQYFMRAFNTSLVKYVDWVVNDSPDSTGQFSGYSPGSLINIVVNRVVTSKVDNFLKPNQSLGGTDGNFFHVNSYDWRNAVAPILPPSNLTGIAVERGISALQAITGASNTSPITITTASPHGLSTGALVTIVGVLGNVGANGTWPIVAAGGPASTTFTLTGSTGTGAYTSGGTAYVPTSMSVLAWDELNQIWRFFFNTNGDGTTVGASQDVSVNNFLVGGYIAIGPDPADTGAIRLSNNQYIFSESNPSGTDVQLIGGDTFNRIKLGSLTTDTVYTPGVIVVDGYIQHDGTGSDTAQTTGFIREKNNTNIIAFRGAGSLAGSDIVALGSNSINNVVLGDSVNTGVLYKTSTGSLHQFQVNTSPFTSPVFELGTGFARFTNDSTVGDPSIYQTTSTVGNGKTLTLQAQNAAPGANIGGNLILKSGTSGVGGSAHGYVDIVTGADGSNPPKIRIFPTSNSGSDNNSILYGENLFRVDAAQSNPLFRQDARTTAGNGNSYTIQAQDATLSALNKGGNLVLTTGKGFAAVQDGYLFVQTGTGAVPQIIVSPVNQPAMSYPVSSGKVTITGNLEVQGTTTTVDSTIVDIVGQVIHANWADPAISSPVAIPTTNTGYSIHRGNTGGVPGVPRDGAAWIWAEPGDLANGADGYWRALTIPGDGAGNDPAFNYTNSTNIVGVMGLDFSSSSDPNPVNGYLAASGGLRTTNNVPIVVARNRTRTTTITSLSNLVDLAAIPGSTLNVASTTGFSAAGTILIFSDAGVQTLTYTGTTGTTFTGVSAGTGIIHTGNYVAQTHQSTTTTGTQSLPTTDINVTSTTGFPTSGVLRIVSNVTAGSGTAQSVQVVSYTGLGTGPTRFTGCTGGTGTTFAGGSVTSLSGGLTTLSQSFGTVDNVLVGTDFGNRILWGSPTNNTGHIFNTPTGFFYDFQVNSVSQVQLGQADIDASGFFETIQIGPTVSNPRLVQQTRPDTGANNGFNLGVFAQAGQAQTGVVANNNGGNLYLVSGPQGLGGTGAAGIDGYVELRTGFTAKQRIYPTFALSAGDNNSILYFENLFRVDSAQVNPVFRQDTTGSATGQVYTIQAQNAATTGGNLVITSGTGSASTTAGNVKIETGGVDRIVTYPVGSPAGLPQGPSNVPYTEFRDTAQAAFIVPVSAGITSLGFSSSVTGVQIAQLSTTSTPSAPMTVQSQVTTATSGVGGNLSLIAGNATGTTSTGGNLNLASGSGTTTNGVINFQPGGTTQILINSTGQFIQWVSTMANPTINQATTGGASGTTLTVQAQNAATTGGDLTLTSGTGATTAGNVNIQTGAVSRVIVHPAFTEFRDTAEALRITPVSAGTTLITFAATDTAATINQSNTAGATGANMTMQAQNAVTTGGNVIITSGSATTAGNVQLQTGAVDRLVVHPTFSEFRDTAEALRITPVSAGTTQITFAATDTAAQINQAQTASTPSAPMTVQSQVTTAASGVGGNLNLIAGNATGTTSTGGNAILTSGTGTTVAGNVQLQTGAVDRVIVHPTFTEFRDTAEAFRITPVSAGTTQLTFAATDTAVQINQTQTASTPSAPMTIQSQVTTANSGVGGNLNVTAGNATGTTSTGGDLNLSSGSGTTTNGNLNLQAGGSTTARVHTNKFSFLKGRRRNVTSVTTTYAVLVTDDYLAITTLAAPFTITLPSSPTTGDEYLIKDTTGNAGTSNVNISGNGNNIDGSASYTINQAYAAATFTFTGSQWSVS